MQTVKAAAALVNGEVTPALVHAKYGVIRSTATRNTEALMRSHPNIHQDGLESQQVKRAAILIVFGSHDKYPGRIPCTNFERREALYHVATAAMKIPEATQRFGVPNQTIKNDVIKLRSILRLDN